jgi:hypothetical protein
MRSSGWFFSVPEIASTYFVCIFLDYVLYVYPISELNISVNNTFLVEFSFVF